MSEIKCTGNNGNGCFMDSCGHDCGCEGLKEFGEKLIEKRSILGEMSKYQKLYEVCISNITSLLDKKELKQ